MKEEKNELNKSRYFEYYADSQLKKVSDRNGRVIEHYYDNLGRETEERWKSGASTVRSITFGYDANSQLKSADDTGTSARNYDWFYDNIGRLKETEFQAQSSLWEFTNKYDDASRRERRDVLRAGSTQFTDTFVWYNDSRLKSLQRDAVNWGQDLRADFTYNAAGQIDVMTRYSDLAGSSLIVTSDYGYDNIGRLTSLDHARSGTNIARYRYTHYANGTIKDFDNLDRTTENVDLVYDRTNQLLTGDRINTPDDEAYAYDGAGNRTTANGATYVTNANNRLTDDGTFTYTYDDEGNRLTRVRKSGNPADDKTVEYTWDYRNRLEKVTFKRNDGTITKTVDFRYDMFNQLTQRVVDPDGALGSAPLQTDDHIWESGELVGVYGYNSIVFAYGPAPDMVLFESATTLHTLLGDHQNTVRDVIATNGTIENHLVYNSYGELKSQAPGGYSPFHRFTGKPFDTAVGLQYNVNRWYDPVVGRWTSEDPIGFAGGDSNLNRFVGNSPTNFTDPFGTFEPGDGIRSYQARRSGLGEGVLPSQDFQIDLKLPTVIVASDGTRYWKEPDGTITTGDGKPTTTNRHGEPTPAVPPGTPSLSEPSSEKLAYVAIAVGGGFWAYAKDFGLDIIESWLGPSPGPAPSRPGRQEPGPIRNVPQAPPVRLFHQGNLHNGVVSDIRPLSTSQSPNLTHYHPDGQLFQFDVPEGVFNNWLQNQLVLPFTDLHAPTGVITPGFQVLPPASGQMNNFIVPRR